MRIDVIRKINKIGKAGTIAALIAKIFVILLLALCFFALVVLLILPSDVCTVNINGKAEVLMNLGFFGLDTDGDEGLIGQIKNGVEENAVVDYAGNHFRVDRVDVDGSQVAFGASGKLTEFNVKSLARAVAGAMLNLVLLLISVIFVSRLAKAVRDCLSPFEDRVIQRMKQFAYSLIPWAVISSVVGSLEQQVWIAGGGFSFDLDIGMIIIVLVILALAYIFQYGAMLQKESDETL